MQRYCALASDPMGVPLAGTNATIELRFGRDADKAGSCLDQSSGCQHARAKQNAAITIAYLFGLL